MDLRTEGLATVAWGRAAGRQSQLEGGAELRELRSGTDGLIVVRGTRLLSWQRYSYSPWISFSSSSRLVPAHPALVNAIVLVLHSVAGSTPLPGTDNSSRSMPSSSYRDMPGNSQENIMEAPTGPGSGPGNALLSSYV